MKAFVVLAAFSVTVGAVLTVQRPIRYAVEVAMQGDTVPLGIAFCFTGILLLMLSGMSGTRSRP